MNFLPFEGVAAEGAQSIRLGAAEVAVPDLREGARGRLALGVRPEHIRLDDAAPYRGRVAATEYLGTTQIVTLDTAHGAIKARVASADPVAVGATTGLAFDARTLSVFEAERGRVLASAANERVLRHG